MRERLASRRTVDHALFPARFPRALVSRDLVSQHHMCRFDTMISGHVIVVWSHPSKEKVHCNRMGDSRLCHASERHLLLLLKPGTPSANRKGHVSAPCAVVDKYALGRSLPFLSPSTQRLMIRSLFRRAGLLALAASLIAPAALAQDQQPQRPAPKVDVSDEEAQNVAKLVINIGDIRTEYQSRLQEADGPDNVRAVQQEMKGEINQAIEDFDGLTTERYDKIMRAAQADDELKQRIMTEVQKEREKREESGE